jgi:hypothetical protein
MAIFVEIGNSDDKLAQEDWSRYVTEVQLLIDRAAGNIYSTCFSLPSAPWQNAVWHFKLSRERIVPQFKDELTRIGKRYFQESIAFTNGETEFLECK